MEKKTDAVGLDVILVVGDIPNTDIWEWVAPESTVNSS